MFLLPDRVRTLIAEIGKKRFTVWFEKRDGTIRKMICQRGVTKYLKGGSSTLPDDLIGVYDHQSKAYRCFSIHKVLRIRSGKLDTDS